MGLSNEECLDNLLDDATSGPKQLHRSNHKVNDLSDNTKRLGSDGFDQCNQAAISRKPRKSSLVENHSISIGSIWRRVGNWKASSRILHAKNIAKRIHNHPNFKTKVQKTSSPKTNKKDNSFDVPIRNTSRASAISTRKANCRKSSSKNIGLEEFESLNSEGFKREGKIGWFKGICAETYPEVVAIHETKCNSVTDAWIKDLDFNEIRGQEERKNCIFIDRRASLFNNFIEKMQLIEVPLIGKRYTRTCDNGVKLSKLDRFLVSEQLANRWGELSAMVFDRNLSDHCPVLLRANNVYFRPKPFKIFDTWLDHKDVDNIICNAWNITMDGNKPDIIFRKRLKNVKEELRAWSKKQFEKIDQDIETLKDAVKNWERLMEERDLDDNERELSLNTRKLWLEKESEKSNMLKQKSREENPATIKEEVLSYFSNIFKEGNYERKKVASPVYNSITSDDAHFLEQPFCEDEIWNAIIGCESSKPPAPDGFSFKFFKKYWELIKDDLMRAMCWFWEKSEISHGCNASFLSLIPKKKDPQDLGDYRPISLIESDYKIIDKSAFISEKSILDGILILNEAIVDLKTRREKCFIFKVDFSKAFDSVNWEFLLDTMQSMRFGVKWWRWIESCLKSALVSILVNGSPTREFKLGRGIRQGDPLSPFLFLIVGEGLNFLTKVAINNGLYKGVKIGNDSIPFSHLQYAVDTIFIGEWSTRNINNTMKLLKCYEEVSGLSINIAKCSLYGIGVLSTASETMASLLNCKNGSFPLTYLGLPVGAKMKNVMEWDLVMKKFQKRFSE
ncbi:uncharacterized protein [Rutidosis leptorrhynchoides]|uniref:uncharacterized protein n=1 Tax=Rutidosis leptorrhynchoides TaxID=125765 RepID=UPI003A990D29